MHAVYFWFIQGFFAYIQVKFGSGTLRTEYRMLDRDLRDALLVTVESCKNHIVERCAVYTYLVDSASVECHFYVGLALCILTTAFISIFGYQPLRLPA